MSLFERYHEPQQAFFRPVAGSPMFFAFMVRVVDESDIERRLKDNMKQTQFVDRF